MIAVTSSTRAANVSRPSGRRAFTLIELLVVVAIIAILAAIAVPNFLEAQTRSKVSRAKADMRVLASALEMYAVDNNHYPLSQFLNLPGAVPANWLGEDEIHNPALNLERRVLERLSTPLAYITSGFVPDVFRPDKMTVFGETYPEGLTRSFPVEQDLYLAQYIKYAALSDDPAKRPTQLRTLLGEGDMFVLISAGPARDYMLVGASMYFFEPGLTEAVMIDQFYDPTNGTVSHGGLFRAGGTITSDADPAGRFVAMVRRAAMR